MDNAKVAVKIKLLLMIIDIVQQEYKRRFDELHQEYSESMNMLAQYLEEAANELDD